MESAASKRIVHQLAYDWVRVELPIEYLTYADYINILSGLHVITNDIGQTAQISAAVIDQAQRLGYSSEWVRAELRFEAQAVAVGDRVQWLLTDLTSKGGDNDSLDLFNERLNRFSNE